MSPRYNFEGKKPFLISGSSQLRISKQSYWNRIIKNCVHQYMLKWNASVSENKNQTASHSSPLINMSWTSFMVFSMVIIEEIVIWLCPNHNNNSPVFGVTSFKVDLLLQDLIENSEMDVKPPNPPQKHSRCEVKWRSYS